VELILPRNASVLEGERFLEAKKEWVLSRLRYDKGAEDKFLYLGEEIALEREFKAGISKHIIKFNRNTLSVASPSGSRLSDGSIYEKWLRAKSEEFIPRRTEYLANIHGFKAGRISIRNQKTRWGSCSASGSLSFNYKLMKFREEIIDYVIIRELCHLMELNHSPRFWKIVSSILPEYKSLRKELKSFNRN
jgi:predicted metal-dependent hydrolase